MLGRTVARGTGDDRVELGVDSLEGGEGERYMGFNGGSLNCMSPDVSRGYKDEGAGDTVDGVSLAGGPRCTLVDNLGSTGAGRVVGMAGCTPEAALRGTMVRLDLLM